jgi:Xaa-Pro aminopeptidase
MALSRPALVDGEPPRIAAAEFQERQAAAIRACAERGLDGLLVWSRGGVLDSFHDIHYLCNHFSPITSVPELPGVRNGCEQAGLVLSLAGEPTLVVGGLRGPDLHVGDVRQNLDLCSLLIEVLKEHSLDSGRVGLVGWEVFPAGFAQQVAGAFPSLTLTNADDVTLSLRARLTPTEIEIMRFAGAAGFRVCNATLSAAVPGATEGEMIGAGLAEAATISRCAHWWFLSSSGSSADRLVTRTLPPWDATLELQDGDTVHPDMYGFVDGYVYDLARTAVVGGVPTASQERVIEGTREAVFAMAHALRPGTTPRKLHQLGLNVLERYGLQSDAFGFGHGIGEGFVHPWICPYGPDVDRPLEAPLGLSFEVFARSEDGEAGFHEDNFVLTEEEVLGLTTFDGEGS